MDTLTIFWVIVVVVAVTGAVIAFRASRSRNLRVAEQRARAAEIRQKAIDNDRRLREGAARAAEARQRSHRPDADTREDRLERRRRNSA